MEYFEVIQAKYVVAALFYSTMGIVILAVSFVLLDLFTPKVAVWKELVENKNIALAIFLGSVALGISTIIAAAVHG